MSTTLEAIRPIELAEVQEARKRIAGTIVRTPLIRLELGPDYPDTGSSWRTCNQLMLINCAGLPMP